MTCVIARRHRRLYSRAVRKLCWQRWALMLLLVTRLVIGELGHTMPITAMAPLEQASSEIACAEHESSGQQTSDAHPANEVDHSAGEHDCCKSGECECPCLHAPCAVIEAAVTDPVAPFLLRIPQGADNVTSQRPSGLFRPPA